jgi:hypothetical protein
VSVKDRIVLAPMASLELGTDCMSVKDHVVLAPMVSLELCTDCMPVFMGPIS